MEKLIIVAPLTNISDRVRLFKLYNLCQEKGIDLEFWGYKNRENLDEHLAIKKHYLVEEKNDLLKKMKWYPILFLVKLFIYAFRNREGKFYSLGLLTSSVLFTVKKFKSIDYLFDHADNFSMLKQWSNSLVSLIRRWEYSVGKDASIHLLPSERRILDYDKENIRIVTNTPSKEIYNYYEENKIQLTNRYSAQLSDRLVIYVNGYLSEDRGFPILEKALKHMKNSDCVLLLVAGNKKSPSLNRIIEEYHSIDLGILNGRDSFLYYSIADVVFTYFNPANPINTMAESNKWGDCIFTNTPFIVNDEVKTVPEQANGVFRIPYHDDLALAKLLDSLTEDPAILEEKVTELEAKEKIFWNDQMSGVIDEYIHPKT